MASASSSSHSSFQAPAMALRQIDYQVPYDGNALKKDAKYLVDGEFFAASGLGADKTTCSWTWQGCHAQRMANFHVHRNDLGKIVVFQNWVPMGLWAISFSRGAIPLSCGFPERLAHELQGAAPAGRAPRLVVAEGREYAVSHGAREVVRSENLTRSRCLMSLGLWAEWNSWVFQLKLETWRDGIAFDRHGPVPRGEERRRWIGVTSMVRPHSSPI